MTLLDEMQFELLSSEDTADDGYTFGIGLEVSINDDGFSPGSLDWATQDVDNTARGFTQFGKDSLAGPTWSWQAHVNRADTAGALDSLGRASTAWRARGIADTPGAVLPLRYRVGDRLRRVYGRPRDFSSSPDNRILGGFIPMTKSFKCVDDRTYDDDLSTFAMVPNLGPPSTLKFPLKFPIQSSVKDVHETAVRIEGDTNTYPVIRINGPITNPYIMTRDWSITLSPLSLAADETLVIDLRPWHLSLLKNGTESVAGLLGRKQWIVDMYLEPGDNQFIFGGTGASGGATAAIEWRNAWTSL